MWRCACGGVHVEVYIGRCACGGVHVEVYIGRCACGGVHVAAVTVMQQF